MNSGRVGCRSLAAQVERPACYPEQQQPEARRPQFNPKVIRNVKV